MKNKDVLKTYISRNKLDMERLIEDYYNYIYIVVKNMSSIAITDEDIEEILSDTFLAVWKNLKRLNKDTNIKSYLVGAAKNITRNKYRETTMDFSIYDYEEQLYTNFNVEISIEEKERSKAIKDIVKALDEEEYNIFIMYYYDDMKVKEISKILGLSESNIKIKLYRIRENIKNKLKNGGYGYEK